ncbi:MAG: dynamin family protein [Candidatus Binatia bacterium]|nr:dynamin family protein [Candidatus Binatia bacterium]
MIGQRFQEKKRAVLDIVERYKACREGMEDGVDLDFLEQRARALEEERYILLVIGEVKAGKSTLINALLGERILPTHVLQSSSAIIEICKSDKKFVKVRYADGHEEIISDDVATLDVDKVSEHLRRIAALPDRFREIPTTLIDDWIVQGRIVPGQPVPIDELQAASGLPLDRRENLIEEYIQGRQLKDIPQEIVFGFPLKYGFDGLRLVDSPGVNAVGGVQDRTFAYLRRANAILFVHPLTAPIESSSFKKFVERTLPDRDREVLFLVLTKSGECTAAEVKGKVDGARSLYGQWFAPERIIPIDSMFKVIADELLDFDSPTALERYYEERWSDEDDMYERKCDLLGKVLNRLSRGGADATRDAVLRELRQRSNFDALERLLDEFSSKAPELQLRELLRTVRCGYENRLAAHEQNIALLEQKKRHPQTFDQEIERVQQVLEEYRRALNDFSEKMQRRYTGVDTDIRKEIQKLRDTYAARVTRQIDSIEEIGSIEDSIRKESYDFNDQVGALLRDIAEQIRKDYSNKMRELQMEVKEQHRITVPKIDVDGTIERARSTSEKELTIWERFKRWLLKRFFGGLTAREAEHWRSEFRAEMDRVADKALSIISDFLDKYQSTFRAELQRLINARQAALEELKVQKMESEKILQRIEDEGKKKKVVQEEKNRVDEILGDIG